MKIFIGNNNVAGQITDIKNCFAELGVDCITATFGNPHACDEGVMDYDFSKYKKHNFDLVKPTKLKLFLRDQFNMDGKIFRKAMKECDVFIFIWDTFKYNYDDLEKIKKAGKKIIHVFCGDDARWFFSQKQEFEMYKMRSIEYDSHYSYSAKALDLKLEKLRKVEKYADFIFSRLDQAQIQLRPYYRWNMMVRPERYNNANTQRELNPIVAHAPTSRKVKGTNFVFDAFERLKQENILFTPLLIEGVINTNAIKMYESADIVIDQLIIPGTGKLASEAMALGKVVMGHMAYDRYPQKNPSECPIIDINPDTVYDELKKIILDYARRQDLAKRGRSYVEKYLDTKIFCQKVLDLINKKKIDFDYEPTFFYEHFIPESEEAKIVYNKWNNFVANEAWYKSRIKKGERSGLVF